MKKSFFPKRVSASHVRSVGVFRSFNNDQQDDFFDSKIIVIDKQVSFSSGMKSASKKSGGSLCSYCSVSFDNWCESCMLNSALHELASQRGVSVSFIMNLQEVLSSIKVPLQLHNSQVCNRCLRESLSICHGCFIRKFNGVAREVSSSWNRKDQELINW